MRKLEKSGWNLNPMFYWQYVKGSSDRMPCILVKGEPTDKIKKLIADEKYSLVNWIVEDGTQTLDKRNVLYRERNRMTDKEWLRGLSNIDYLICDEEHYEYWMPIALCGVKILFNEDDTKPEARVRSYLERIESWEWAKNLLT